MTYQPWGGSDDSSLGEAKEFLRSQLSVGAHCPCCQQIARQYRRKLNSGMALALVRMWQAHGTAWQDKTATLRGQGAAARDESLLRFWGLLQEFDGRRDDGGHTGWWRVTGLGEDFIRGRARVRSHAVIYDGQFRYFDGEWVSLQECLGSRFNLAELLEAA